MERVHLRVKTVEWHSASKSLKREGIPQKFTLRSKVIIISNDWRSLNRNVVALQDRGFVLLFEPTAEEVHREAGRWFKQAQPAVYEWFSEHLNLIMQPSLRHYIRAAMLKDANMDWTEVLPMEIENRRERLVAELQADPAFETQEARAEAFSARGGGSRRTYFNYAKRLRGKSGAGEG